MSQEIKNLKELKQISFDLVQDFQIPQIVLLKGDLAVGKTQMVQYMAQALGIESKRVHSPTFSIINFYRKNTGVGIYHVDLYRIKKVEDLEVFAFWDIFYDPAVVFIEWPEIVEKKLPGLWNKLFIQLELSQKTGRRFLKWKRQLSK